MQMIRSMQYHLQLVNDATRLGSDMLLPWGCCGLPNVVETHSQSTLMCVKCLPLSLVSRGQVSDSDFSIIKKMFRGDMLTLLFSLSTALYSTKSSSYNWSSTPPEAVALKVKCPYLSSVLSRSTCGSAQQCGNRRNKGAVSQVPKVPCPCLLQKSAVGLQLLV